MVEEIAEIERQWVEEQQVLGRDNDITFRSWKRLTEACNVNAMQALQQDDMKLCQNLLRRAEVLTEPPYESIERNETRLKLRAITFNNMACYLKKRGMLKTALQYAEKALKIETTQHTADNPACTHLNICAILSQLSRHKFALWHARQALDLLLMAEAAPQEENTPKPPSSMTSIAYHSIGVQLEFLERYEEALRSYQKAVDISAKEVGADHPATLALKETLGQAKKALPAKIEAAKRAQASARR
eukprot:tig00001487_g8930.t1